MARRRTRKHRSNRHKRSLHRRHRRRRRTKHHKKHSKRRRRRRTKRRMHGGARSLNPAPFQGPASMNGAAAPGSNYYAKLQNPNLPDPVQTRSQSVPKSSVPVQKGGGNFLYNIGLGGLQRGWWDFTNAGKNIYHQWNGDKHVPSASSMDQPINEKVKIISYDPPNVSQIYDSGAQQASNYSLQNQ